MPPQSKTQRDQHIDELVSLMQRKRVKKADRDYAAEALFEMFRNGIEYHIKKKVHHIDLIIRTEDIALVTFAKAFQKIKSFNKRKACFSTWLYRIADNTLIDQIRVMEQSHTVLYAEIEYHLSNSFKDTIFEHGSTNYDGIRQVVKKERRDLVRSMVASITNDKERQAIELRYFEELSYDEIQRKMKAPMGSVKAYIFRGSKYLQDNYAIAA